METVEKFVGLGFNLLHSCIKNFRSLSKCKTREKNYGINRLGNLKVRGEPRESLKKVILFCNQKAF